MLLEPRSAPLDQRERAQHGVAQHGAARHGAARHGAARAVVKRSAAAARPDRPDGDLG